MQYPKAKLIAQAIATIDMMSALLIDTFFFIIIDGSSLEIKIIIQFLNLKCNKIGLISFILSNKTTLSNVQQKARVRVSRLIATPNLTPFIQRSASLRLQLDNSDSIDLNKNYQLITLKK